ncbi:hypothetical protein Hanom_Chr11g01013351 [Helianthus anomalus]
MDGVNESDENDKISNLLDPEANKQTFGRKSQNWPNLWDENGILLFTKFQSWQKTRSYPFLTRIHFKMLPNPHDPSVIKIQERIFVFSPGQQLHTE